MSDGSDSLEVYLRAWGVGAVELAGMGERTAGLS